MKRDLDLIRNILLAVEEDPPGGPFLTGPEFEGTDSNTYGEHVRLMHEDGLIEASWIKHPAGPIEVYEVRRLKNAGHDLLDAIRNDTVWNRTKDKVGGTVGSATLEVVKGVAEGFTKAMLGLP